MRDFFYNPVLRKWGERLLMVLLFDYIFLFGAETVLPGFVMGVFNINYLLLAILFLLAYLAFMQASDKDNNNEKGIDSGNKVPLIQYFVISVVLLFLIGISVFSLYKAMVWQTALYIFLAVLSGILIYKNLAAK